MTSHVKHSVLSDPAGSFVSWEGGCAPSKFSSKGGPGKFKTPPVYLPPQAVASRDRDSTKSDPANLPRLIIAQRRSRILR